VGKVLGGDDPFLNLKHSRISFSHENSQAFFSQWIISYGKTGVFPKEEQRAENAIISYKDILLSSFAMLSLQDSSAKEERVGKDGMPGGLPVVIGLK